MSPELDFIMSNFDFLVDAGASVGGLLVGRRWEMVLPRLKSTMGPERPGGNIGISHGAGPVV